jgi:hypothetical protein
MSTATSSSPRIRPAAPGAPRGPRLHAVAPPAARRRPKLVYGVIAVAGAVAILVAQMVLSIMTTEGSYELSKLTSQQRQLTWQKQILYDDVAGLSSPQNLAANATALGMVIDQSPSYLRLSDAKILGKSDAAASKSTVDALGRGQVANALIAKDAIVTDPAKTISGASTSSTSAVDAATPPPLNEGLPVPQTH